MTNKQSRIEGEGNKSADRRYRKAVRETVASTSEKKRAAKARNVSSEELAGAEKAAEKARKKARH